VLCVSSTAVLIAITRRRSLIGDASGDQCTVRVGTEQMARCMMNKTMTSGLGRRRMRLEGKKALVTGAS